MNTEKREKKERQKDHRDIPRSAEVEDEKEESRKQAEAGSHEEIKENPEKEEKKSEQRVTAAPAKGVGTSSISLEGNSVFDIPSQMMSEHCKMWENNQQYKVDGEKLLGMKRHHAASFDVGTLEKGVIICKVVPALKERKFIWTFDFEKAKQNIPDRNSLSVNSCYGYIFKSFEVMSKNMKQMNNFNSSQASTLELPYNIGESLLQKIKEVSDQRKQKKRERMKVRYRREMAGPGYKRGKKFEINSKVSNKPHTSDDVSQKRYYHGHGKVFTEYNMASGIIKKTDMSNKASAQSYSELYRDACSSSEDDNLPARAVRRKGKIKSEERLNSAHAKVPTININPNKCVGEPRNKLSFNKEGAIKTKHQPSFKLTHKFVASSSEKEIVTVSHNSAVENQEFVEGFSKKQQYGIAQPTLTSASNGSNIAILKEKAQSCTTSATDGLSRVPNSNRARRKPKSRRGKKGGSVS